MGSVAFAICGTTGRENDHFNDFVISSPSPSKNTAIEIIENLVLDKPQIAEGKQVVSTLLGNSSTALRSKLFCNPSNRLFFKTRQHLIQKYQGNFRQRRVDVCNVQSNNLKGGQMAISYVVGTGNAPVKKMRIRLKPNLDIVVTCSGMGGTNGAPLTQVITNCGRKPIVIEVDGLALSDISLGGGAITSPYNFFGSPTTQTWKVENHGITPPVNKQIKVQWIEPASQHPLVGPDIYIGLYDYGEKKLKQWVDTVADAGMNYIRLIIPANCWTPPGLINTPDPITGSDYRSLLIKSGSQYDLSAFNNAYFDKFINAINRAKNERRMRIQIDLADNVMAKNGANNGVSEYYNNPLYPGGSQTFEQKYYAALTTGGESSEFGIAIKNLFLEVRNRINTIPGNNTNKAILGDGNEIPDANRSSSAYILSQLGGYTPKAFGGDCLWLNPNINLTAQQISEIRSMGVRYLCVHHIDYDTSAGGATNILTYFNHVSAIFQAGDGVRVLFSTDGTGSGGRRGSGGTRPSFLDLKNLYNTLHEQIDSTRLSGLADIKTLDVADLNSLINYWKNNVYSYDQ